MSDSIIFKISVENCVEKLVNRKAKLFYEIKITYDKEEWKMEKTFNEFKDLHDKLCKVIPNVPQIPDEVMFQIVTSKARNKRKEQFNEFISECINRRDILTHIIFRAFFELDSKIPKIAEKEIAPINQIEQFAYGVIDMKLFNDVMFIICSENETSKGNFLCDKVNSDFSFTKLFDKEYSDNKPSVLLYDEKFELISIGFENGLIQKFKSKTPGQFTEFEIIDEISVHKDKVTGLGYDNDKNFYSCSLDRNFYVTEAKKSPPENLLLLKTSLEGVKGFTQMLSDKEHNRIFLSNSAGQINVFLTNVFPPIEILQLQLSSYREVSSFDICEKSHFIFASMVNGSVSMLSLPPPGKEFLIKEVKTLETFNKITAVKYNMKKSELIIGDDKGRISFWDIKEQKPIHCFNAHTASVTKMIFNEEKQQLITSSIDKTVKIWNIPLQWNEFTFSNKKEEEVTEENGSDSDDDLSNWEKMKLLLKK